MDCHEVQQHTTQTHKHAHHSCGGLRPLSNTIAAEPLQPKNQCPLLLSPVPSLGIHSSLETEAASHINLYPRVSSGRRKKNFLISSFIMTRSTGVQHWSIYWKGKRATKFTFKNCPAPPCHPVTITTLSPDLSKGLTLLPWQHGVLCRAGSSILYQHALSVSSSRLIRAEMFQ